MVIIWLIDSDYNLKLLKEKFEQDKICESDSISPLKGVKSYYYKNIIIDFYKDWKTNKVDFNKISRVSIKKGPWMRYDYHLGIIQVGCYKSWDYNSYRYINLAISRINHYFKETNNKLPEIFNENLLIIKYSEKVIRDILLSHSYVPKFRRSNIVEIGYKVHKSITWLECKLGMIRSFLNSIFNGLLYICNKTFWVVFELILIVVLTLIEEFGIFLIIICSIICLLSLLIRN